MATSYFPDIAKADDAELERLLPSLDGRWSSLTREILAALGSTKLDLNRAWASVATDWACPVCRRRKPEIARLSPTGVVLCQLERHHDHLGDEGVRILYSGQKAPEDRPRADALHSAVQACAGLGERFHPTLVCSDCNAADGAAKAALVGHVHPEFSFAPSEIARFIRVQPNRSHEVNEEAARAVWCSVADDVHERLAFMKLMAQRIAGGRHVREGSPYTPDPKAVVLTDIVGGVLDDHWRAVGLTGLVQNRSIQRDGFGSAAKDTSRKRVAVPTQDDLARFTAESRPSDVWLEPPADWHCAACDRSRFEMLRRSPKSRRWTAAAHRRRIFRSEDRYDALWARNGWYDQGLNYGDHDGVWVCKDCRQIITDTKHTGQDLIDDCLSVDDVRGLLAEVRPHAPHEYDRAAAAERARGNFEIMAAIRSYDRHRARCVGLFHRRRHLLRFDTPSAVDAELVSLVWDDHIEPERRLEHLAWLNAEGERYAEANMREAAIRSAGGASA